MNNEPTFETGDWLRTLPGHENRTPAPIFKIESCLTRFSKASVEPWKPQPDEWCWFHNGTSEDCEPFISKFEQSSYNNAFDYCEPFIGTLPTYLKDTE